MLLSTEKIFSVSELNSAVRGVLLQSFGDLWLSGELGNVTVKQDSGHVYFSLKDSEAQVQAVFWRGSQQFRALQLQMGSKVEAYGRVELYERGGSYQFNVSKLRPLGLGELFQRFEALKERLRSEGLFDLARKKPLPALPRCIGLVTSLEGAAIKDFMQILQRRHPNVHLRIINSPVQGAGAADWLAAAVQYFSQSKACDVIVLTRGGGSVEDLWEFNEEVLARAIAAAEVPVISAVGHERDFTISDEVADFRAPTPSAAAELVIKGQEELRERLFNAAARLRAASENRLAQAKLRWQKADRSAFFQKPEHLTNLLSQRLDLAGMRLERVLRQIAEKTRQRLTNVNLRLPVQLQQQAEQRRARLGCLQSSLEALNPKKVLARGYSIILDEKNQALRKAEQVKKGDKLKAILAEGELDLQVN
ncbi:MAG: exodeoxyribonuclease VII large subunit [Oligosphaeraceae bacterium]|nr:exodeoxyribonuclease VII large subunit [Oligosphaeraceae bacterium]